MCGHRQAFAGECEANCLCSDALPTLPSRSAAELAPDYKPSPPCLCLHPSDMALLHVWSQPTTMCLCLHRLTQLLVSTFVNHCSSPPAAHSFRPPHLRHVVLQQRCQRLQLLTRPALPNSLCQRPLTPALALRLPLHFQPPHLRHIVLQQRCERVQRLHLQLPVAARVRVVAVVGPAAQRAAHDVCRGRLHHHTPAVQRRRHQAAEQHLTSPAAGGAQGRRMQGSRCFQRRSASG